MEQCDDSIDGVAREDGRVKLEMVAGAGQNNISPPKRTVQNLVLKLQLRKAWIKKRDGCRSSAMDGVP